MDKASEILLEKKEADRIKPPLPLLSDSEKVRILEMRLKRLETENHRLKNKDESEKKKFLRSLKAKEKEWGETLDNIYLEHARKDKHICKDAMAHKLKTEEDEELEKGRIQVNILVAGGVPEMEY